MRLALSVVLLALLAAACGTTRADGEAIATPRLVLAATDPVVVRGTGFKRRERVRVLLSSPVLRTKMLVADRRGRFSVRFSLRAGRCAAVVVQAIGAKGSRADVSLDAPDCYPTEEP